MITPDRARELLDGVTPGPWTASREYPEYFMQVYSAEDRWGVTDNGVVEDDDAVLIAAAPDLAQTIAGMEWQWGCRRPNGKVSWIASESGARECCKHFLGDLVRRLVSAPVEVVEGE